MSPPKFFHVGVPILGLVFYAVSVVGLVIQCRGTVPRHSLGKLDLLLKLSMGLCVLQVRLSHESSQPIVLKLINQLCDGTRKQRRSAIYKEITC